jgi:hypothetical protein
MGMRSAALLAGACLVAVIATGSDHTSASPDATPGRQVQVQVRLLGTPPSMSAPITAGARRKAYESADALLGRAILPPGSQPVPTLSGKWLSAPAMTPGLCSAVEDITSRYVVPLGPPVLQAFLLSHIPAGLSRPAGEGVFTDHSITRADVLRWARRAGPGAQAYFVFEQPEGEKTTTSELDFLYAKAGSGSVLRVDAMVVPTDATCEDPGAPPIRPSGRSSARLVDSPARASPPGSGLAAVPLPASHRPGPGSSGRRRSP